VIASPDDLDAVISAHSPGDTVSITVDRGGKEKTLSLTFGSRPDGGISIGVKMGSGGSPGVAAASGKPIDAGGRASALAAVAENLRSGYIYPDKGENFAAKVEAAAKAKRFADAETTSAFVQSVNGFLFDISNDKHLRIGHAERASEGGPGKRVVRQGPAGPGAGGESPHGGTVLRRVGPGGGDGAGHGGAVVRREGPGGGASGHGGPEMRRPGGDGDFGIREARVVDGNIGYLNLSMFAGHDSAKARIDEAMLSLAETDGLIIDLRRNGGGGPWMVRYLSGFLFAEPTHLTDTWARGMEAPAERWTLSGQPTKSFVDKPVYILISGNTFSAAESFTFGLKINDRVTLVGERTGGGGHFGEDVALPENLRMFLPKGRTYDPETGKGWEAEGITPNIVTSTAEALDRALAEL
jgi:hypothetical protein